MTSEKEKVLKIKDWGETRWERDSYLHERVLLDFSGARLFLLLSHLSIILL